MEEMESTVAVDEAIATEAPADDAQAAEISAEELMGNLTGGAPSGEQAEISGDGGQAVEAQQEETQQQEAEGDKVGKRIAAALRQQRRTIFEQLGASEDEVRELIRARKAEKLSKEDPDISPKAARRIVEAEERHAGEDAQKQAITQGIQSLFEDGRRAEGLLDGRDRSRGHRRWPVCPAGRDGVPAKGQERAGTAPGRRKHEARRADASLSGDGTDARQERD